MVNPRAAHGTPAYAIYVCEGKFVANGLGKRISGCASPLSVYPLTYPLAIRFARARVTTHGGRPDAKIFQSLDAIERVHALAPRRHRLHRARDLHPAAPTSAIPAPTSSAVNVNLRAGLTSRWLMDWDARARQTWYLTPQGSLIMPMDIFLALKTADGARLFSSREHLASYGWVYLPESDAAALTMFGLPAGFVQEPNPDNNNVMTFGLTCAACHTGELIVSNVRYVVDGSQPLQNIQNWDIDIAAALGATAREDRRLREMQQAIAARNPQSPYANNFAQMKTDLDAVFQYQEARAKRNTAIVDYGWGRLDAFTKIFDEVIVHDAEMNQKDAQGNYINARPPASPISLPYLWSVPDLECVQTNCVAEDPMVRNLGETLGVYGTFRLRVLPNAPKLDFNDLEALATAGDLLNFSANPNNLFDLEHQLVSLPVPKWQNEFGAQRFTATRRIT